MEPLGDFLPLTTLQPSWYVSQMDPTSWLSTTSSCMLSQFSIPNLAVTQKNNFEKFSGAIYYSEFDFCKAYYRVPVFARDKRLTAFPTHLGLMEFCCLPLGLVTAGATCIRLMLIVIAGLSNVSLNFENIFIYSSDTASTLLSPQNRLRQNQITLPHGQKLEVALRVSNHPVLKS